MSLARERDHATILARTDPHAAAAVAERIDDPWYRAQALAAVVRFSPDRDIKRFFAHARKASEAATDPYLRLGSSAWWLRALVERGRVDEVGREVSALLGIVPTIPNPVNRIDGLFLVLQAVFAVPEARRAVLDALIAAGRAANSWKAGERLRDAALMVAPEHPAEAALVVDAMPEGKYRRQTERRMEAGEYLRPREFFFT
jgi:hypothetical protein